MVICFVAFRFSLFCPFFFCLIGLEVDFILFPFFEVQFYILRVLSIPVFLALFTHFAGAAGLAYSALLFTRCCCLLGVVVYSALLFTWLCCLLGVVDTRRC